MKIVLINPDIPWNAGNIGRTCAATGTELVFGSEGAGLPLEYYGKYKNNLYRIPMVSGYIRSLNLSTSAGVALYEGLRRAGA